MRRIAVAIIFAVFGVIAAAQSPLTIVDLPLPPLVAGMDYRAQLLAKGGEPPYVWSVASGDLPEGITLRPEGCLCGRPAKPGKFSVTLKVEDSAHPAHTITKDFSGTINAALLLEWLDQPIVRDNRIDGSVQVSNGSRETYDLTVVIVAVASDSQRATAIGYEHLPLNPGTENLKIPFGSALPHGSYTIHVDAVAEIPERNSILRQRLQTPAPLPVQPGP